MARKVKAGDNTYNARRRYYRQAERYEQQASKASSAVESSRLAYLARRALEKAIATYEDPTKAKFSKPIQDLASRLSPRKPVRKPTAAQKARLVGESRAKATVSGIKDEQERREIEARDILDSPIGKRIYGALVDIWKDADDRDAAIMDYFGVDSMMDVIEALERMGFDLYSDPESQEKYDEIRTALEYALK